MNEILPWYNIMGRGVGGFMNGEMKYYVLKVLLKLGS